jgi:pyrroline-5-carboxylate reductase
LIKKVASKGGTTEKALESFTKNNLKKIITDALDSVLIRANEMEKFVNQ